ncbi:Cytoplasmic tRNA 2-thiolation protein 2 [Blyttiomyces sp. JEL0837]|nr:Cytoplasmic tRNA 2-thiolation protein 2 [Blyttiomyces sp. JEL0837]
MHFINDFHEGRPVNAKRRFAEVLVCHIDTSILTGSDDKIATNLNMKFKSVPIDEFFLDDDGKVNNVLVMDTAITDHHDQLPMKLQSSTATATDLLKQLFDSISSATTAQTLLSTMINRLLIRTALKESTSEGAGFSLPQELSHEEKLESGLIVVRPMRDIFAADVDFVIEQENVKVAYTENPLKTRFTGEINSIQELSDKFIADLQRDFPQTVNTVTRTAFKIATNSGEPGVQQCPLCSR